MGNAAAKELEETALGEGVLHKEEDDSSIHTTKAIAPALVTKDVLFKAKKSALANSWHIEDKPEEVLFKFKHVGVRHSHAQILDRDDNVLAYVVIDSQSLFGSCSFIFKSTPSFEGQAPVLESQIERAGIEKFTRLYPFSKINTKRNLNTGAESVYSLVKKGGHYEELYTATKFPHIKYLAAFKAGDTLVAKAAHKDMSPLPSLEAGIGVDPIAIVCIGNTLVGDHSAGGLLGDVL